MKERLKSVKIYLPCSAENAEVSGNLGRKTVCDGETIDLTEISRFDDNKGEISIICCGEEINVNVLKSENVKAMYIVSDDALSYGRNYVDAVKGRGVGASMTLISLDGSVIYDNALSEIKSRGKSLI